MSCDLLTFNLSNESEGIPNVFCFKTIFTSYGCLNFSNKSKIKCATNAAAISGGMSHTMFPVIFVSILLYNLQKMFFSTVQQISMSNSHRTSCEFLKDIFGRISGADLLFCKKVVKGFEKTNTIENTI